MKDAEMSGCRTWEHPDHLIPWWYAGTPTMFFDEYPDLRNVAKEGGNIYEALRNRPVYKNQREIKMWVVNEHGC